MASAGFKADLAKSEIPKLIARQEQEEATLRESHPYEESFSNLHHCHLLEAFVLVVKLQCEAEHLEAKELFDRINTLTKKKDTSPNAVVALVYLIENQSNAEIKRESNSAILLRKTTEQKLVVATKAGLSLRRLRINEEEEKLAIPRLQLIFEALQKIDPEISKRVALLRQELFEFYKYVNPQTAFDYLTKQASVELYYPNNALFWTELFFTAIHDRKVDIFKQANKICFLFIVDRRPKFRLDMAHRFIDCLENIDPRQIEEFYRSIPDDLFQARELLMLVIDSKKEKKHLEDVKKWANYALPTFYGLIRVKIHCLIQAMDYRLQTSDYLLAVAFILEIIKPPADKLNPIMQGILLSLINHYSNTAHQQEIKNLTEKLIQLMDYGVNPWKELDKLQNLLASMPKAKESKEDLGNIQLRLLACTQSKLEAMRDLILHPIHAATFVFKATLTIDQESFGLPGMLHELFKQIMMARKAENFFEVMERYQQILTTAQALPPYLDIASQNIVTAIVDQDMENYIKLCDRNFTRFQLSQNLAGVLPPTLIRLVTQYLFLQGRKTFAGEPPALPANPTTVTEVQRTPARLTHH